SRIWKHAKSLIAMGHTVHLICPWEVPEGNREDVNFHTFKRVIKRPLRPFLIPGRVLRKLCPLLGQIDLAHFHDIDILPWMALVSLIKPVVYDVHENYPEEMLVRNYIPNFLRKPMYHLVRWGQFVLSLFIRNIIFVV